MKRIFFSLIAMVVTATFAFAAGAQELMPDPASGTSTLPTTTITADQVATMISGKQWVPLAALAIFILTRLVKDDVKFFPNLPARARIFFVFTLGIADAVLDHVANGSTWQSALVGAGVSVAMAVLAHETVISSLLGGKEIPIPLLTVPGARPSPSAPVTVPSATKEATSNVEAKMTEAPPSQPSVPPTVVVTSPSGPVEPPPAPPSEANTPVATTTPPSPPAIPPPIPPST